MTELVYLKLFVSPLSFESESTEFGCLVLEVNFGVSLGQVKESQSVVFLNLFKVISSLVVEIELPSIAFVWSVVVSVNTWVLFTSLVSVKRFAQTTNATFEIFPVDKAESQHIVTDNEVLVEFWDLFGLELGQFNQGLSITFNWVIILFNVWVNFSQNAVWDEVVLVIFLLNKLF